MESETIQTQRFTPIGSRKRITLVWLTEKMTSKTLCKEYPNFDLRSKINNARIEIVPNILC